MDEDDRLVQVSKGVYASGAVLVNEFTVQYSYDSMGRMLRRDNGTGVTTFVWDGWDLLSETTDSVTTTYLVPDGLVWSFSRGEDVFQVHTDALGSVRVVTDSDGDVVARFEFSGWGALLPGSFDNVGLALRFIGGLGVRTDLETGLACMRHRWYDPTLQRFISRDPIGLRGGVNLYRYSRNNPTTEVDPEGLRPYRFAEEQRFSDALGILSSIRGPGNYKDVAKQSHNDRVNGLIKVDFPQNSRLDGLLAATRGEVTTDLLAGKSYRRIDILLSEKLIDGSNYLTNIRDATDYRYGSALLLSVALLKENYHLHREPCPKDFDAEVADSERRGYREVLIFLVRLGSSEFSKGNLEHVRTIHQVGELVERSGNNHLRRLYGDRKFAPLPSFFGK